MPWPWSRKKRRKIPPQTPLAKIRTLYSDYQNQRNLWLYVILSSLALICIWIVATLLGVVDLWATRLPAAGVILQLVPGGATAGVVISVIQLRQIQRISDVLRAAHAIQQQVDRSDAERRSAPEGAAGPAVPGPGPAAPAEAPEPTVLGDLAEGGSDDDGPEADGPSGPPKEEGGPAGSDGAG